MSYFLFVDESGHDRRFSPAEVLGGFSIRDANLWRFVQKVFSLQKRMFGITYSELNSFRQEKFRQSIEENQKKPEWEEIKGNNFLTPRVFKNASRFAPFHPSERKNLAEKCLRFGDQADGRSISALAQAKIAYVNEVFELCRELGSGLIGIVVPRDAPGDRQVTVLRKDYAYLFERFFYFVRSKSSEHLGIIVFDEIDKSASHILLGQMQAYYRDFRTGRDRAEKIVPEPFFVHSDLSIGIQVADLVAYALSWGHPFHRKPMVPHQRKDLGSLLQKINSLAIKSRITETNKPKVVEGIYVVKDLRPKLEKEKGNAAFATKPSHKL